MVVVLEEITVLEVVEVVEGVEVSGPAGDCRSCSSPLSPVLGASTGVWNEIKLKTEGDKLSEVHYS